MPAVTFTLDAEVADRRFTVDAWITGNRLRHDRTLDHTGVETADTVVLSTDVGPYPAGTTVQAVLEAFSLRLFQLEQSNLAFGYFSVQAFILPHFWVNAVIKRSVSSSFTVDAVVTLVGPHSFTVDSVIKTPSSSGSFTVSAFIT